MMSHGPTTARRAGTEYPHLDAIRPAPLADSITFDQALAECERRGLVPIQGGAILAVAAVVGALASAYASYSASQAQAAAAKYQGRVAQEQANAAAQAGKIAEENQREQDARMMAAQRVRIGATGAEETIGAPLLAEMESASAAELNARRIRWSAETRAAGFESEKIGQAFAATQYKRQGYIQAGAALLTGAGKAAAYGGGGGGGGGGTGASFGGDYGSTPYRT